MRHSNLVLGVEDERSLLRESNHRIANSLMTIATLLRHQSRQLTKRGSTFSADDVHEIFNDAGQRLELVGRLHRRLAEPIAPDVLNLAPYLNDVAETAIDFLSPPGEVELEPISSDMCPVDAGQALLIGIIVGDLVTSAVTFARRAGASSKLKLTCRAGDEGMHIVIANDGVRASGGCDLERDDSVGLGVAKLLAGQLKATLTFEAGATGLVARMLVPIKPGIDLAELRAAGEA